MTIRNRLRDALRALGGAIAQERVAHAIQIAKLNDECLAKMGQAVAARTEAETLRAETVTLREQIATVEGALQAAREDFAALQAQKSAGDETLRSVNAQLETALARVGSLDASLEGLRKNLAASVEREQALVRASASLEKRLTAQSEQIASIESQLTGKHNYIGALEAQAGADRERIAELETALSQRDEAIRDTEAGVQLQLKEQLAAAEQALTSARADADEHKARADELQVKFNNLEGTHNWLKERWDAVRIPPLLITTMPRSGTYYISKLFSEGLRIKSTIVSNQYFPDDTIRYHALKELANGNYVSQDHFGASHINLTHISRYMDRVLCHVRDPRQALLSWIHHIEQFRGNEETHLFIYPPLPESYYEDTLEKKIDWALENWLPLLVRWAEEWVAVADSATPVRVKITHYEDMVRDENTFIDEVLDFFAVPRERFTPVKIALDEAVHFRKGEAEEWKSVFTAAQRERAAALLPKTLAMRMGWNLAP